MNFWSNSVKGTSPAQNESVYLDLETPRGHFFAVLDFVPHDYANLDATLKRKIETIVRSFDSVPGFSVDLFLGFLAKEINNFLHELGQQSPDPALFSSAALCLVSGNRLAYFLCGELKLIILGRDRLHSLHPGCGNGPLGPVAGLDPAGGDTGEAEPRAHATGLGKLGAGYWSAPLTERLPAFSLHDDDIVLITTSGAAQMVEREFAGLLENPRSSGPGSLWDALVETSSVGLGEGVLLAIKGPYDPFVDPSLTDLRKAFDSLEARVNALTDGGQLNGATPELLEKTLDGELEQKINPQINELKDALSRKANSIDVLELNEILKNLGPVLASKADTTELLSLQRDVLKLGIENQRHGPNGSDAAISRVTIPSAETNNDGQTSGKWGREDSDHLAEDGRIEPAVDRVPQQKSFGVKVALLVFALAIVGAFMGAWLQSRILKKNPEVWLVKASGNQIWITRMDQGGQGSVALNLAAPVRSHGEQTFSSFADVKNYVDTIAGPQLRPDQTARVVQEAQIIENHLPDTLPKVVAKPDSLVKQPAQAQKTTLRKPPEQNAKPGKKPETSTSDKSTASSIGAGASTLQRNRRALANSAGVTSQIKIAAGDTLEKLARRYKTTSEELRKLNPQINEKGVIQPNQKIKVPASPSPSEPKGRRLVLVSKRTNLR